MPEASPHYPVMLNEVLDYLKPAAGEVYVDGTLGAGGYTRAILSAEKTCNVIGFDRDQTAHDMAAKWKSEFGDRLTLVKSSFAHLEEELAKLGIEKVDAVILDLGVSSMQFDQGDRGFSFRFDAPLDMRMDRDNGQTAADLVNGMPEKELANLIYLYGEERKSRQIASAIVRKRTEQKIETTFQLADIIRTVVPPSWKDKSDPATRTFQALRIAVNEELNELETVLQAAENVLNENGRLIVVTFHSLEDRIVKQFLNERGKPAPSPSRHMPITVDDRASNRLSFSLLTKKPVLPTEKELSENPRSRSAKLRAALRKNSGRVVA